MNGKLSWRKKYLAERQERINAESGRQRWADEVNKLRNESLTDRAEIDRLRLLLEDARTQTESWKAISQAVLSKLTSEGCEVIFAAKKGTMKGRWKGRKHA